jgi:hypothetical protein
MTSSETVQLASIDWQQPDPSKVRFIANSVSGSIGRGSKAANLFCLLSAPLQPLLPKYVPYGILTVPEGGFLRKKLTYRHVLNHQLMPDVWNNNLECEMSLKNAVNIAGEGLSSGRGEHYDLTVADGEQAYNVTDRNFAALYYDQPATIGSEVVRSVIAATNVPFEPVPITIYGYKQGNEERWELRVPGWLDTFAIMSDRRKAQEAADGLTYHIGIAAQMTSIAKLISPTHQAGAQQSARQCVGIVTNFGRMYSGMEMQ